MTAADLRALARAPGNAIHRDLLHRAADVIEVAERAHALHAMIATAWSNMRRLAIDSPERPVAIEACVNAEHAWRDAVADLLVAVDRWHQ